MKPRLTWLLAVLVHTLIAAPLTLCSLMFEVVEEDASANVLIGTLNFTAEITSYHCKYHIVIVGNELRTTEKLDREEIFKDNDTDTITCEVTLHGSAEQGVEQELIDIKVLDINDNKPHFNELDKIHVENVTENTNIPHKVVSLEPVDGDSGVNGTVEFSITKGNDENFFYIGPPLDSGENESELVLFINRTVDYEEFQSFNVTISMHDLGTPPQYFEQIIIVDIEDINDADPIFIITNYNTNVSESHPLGPENWFFNVSAVDLDSGTSIYSIYAEPIPDNALDYIAIDNITGQLYLKQAIDYDTQPTLHSIQILVAVHEEGAIKMDIARVNIMVLDVNDDGPVIEFFHGPEAFPENKYLGNSPIIFRAYDDTDEINWPIVELYPPISNHVAKIPGSKLFMVVIEATLDREKVEHFTVNFTVYDKGTPPLAESLVVVFVVQDENDNSPNFSQEEYNVIVGEHIPLQKIAATVQATDPDFGENGFVLYSISSTNPPVAQSWFDIDKLTGEIRVMEHLNYNLAEHVSIIVTASDNGTVQANSSSAAVNIEISPTITFKPRSYQQHCSPYTKIQDTSMIYLEFRTSEKNGFLLYEELRQGEFFALGIDDGKIIALSQNAVQDRFDAFDVSTNYWISVLYDVEQKTLNVSYTEQLTERESILRASEIVRCDSSMHPINQTFFVGGIDVFSQFPNASVNSGDFVGTIRNLVVDSVQVDLRSPIREENTAHGALFPTEPMCGELEMRCSGPHYTGCLDYDTESHCICAGGFNTEACDKEENYAPIQLSSSSKVRIVVDDYALFFDLVHRSGLIGPPPPTPPTITSRERRTLPDAVTEYQLVEFHFRLLRRSTGILLYSETESSIHALQIELSESATEYTILYTVSDMDLTSYHVYISETQDYVLGDLYKVVINMTATHFSVSLNGTERVQTWTTIAPLIQYPHTAISLGWTNNSKLPKSNFTGCIAKLAVNGIEFPLNGLVENNELSIGGSGSSVSTTCDLCQQEVSPCHESSQCVNNVDSYVCECPPGKVLGDDGQCDDVSKPSSTPTAGLANPSSSSGIPLYYIIPAAVGTSVLLAGLVTVVGYLCCRHRKRQNQSKTYHVGGDHQLPSLGGGFQHSRPNSYSDVTRRPSLCNSEPGFITSSQHNHESSVSTSCNEHDIDEDTESNTHHMTRSKSSTSGETGFHTASEREDQRSFPRMDDSGNEKETDYSPFDTESDESQSYVGVHSTTSVGLRNSKARGLTLPHFTSPSGSVGPVSGVGAPLTPKEKKFITPLRPDSRSELGEETDLDTDFSSTVLAHQAGFNRSHRGGSLKLPGRPDSGMSGHQWYKASTSSDLERERKRAEGSHAYYPPPHQFYSFRRPRAASASSPHSGVQHISPPKPLTLSHMQTSRFKRETQSNSPPVSPLTSYDHRHNTQHSRAHQKQRDTAKASETSELSVSVLSRSQPLKMCHPFFRQSSDSPRIPPHLAARSYIPSYMRSYSEESTQKGEKKFVDLGSVRTNCDPIQYWEGQRRMMATVDQVDAAYPVLSESFTPFEDSAGESQQSGPEQQSFSSQGGGEGTAEALDVGLLQDCETDSVATGTTLKCSQNESKLMLFPSADCSEEYRCTPRIISTVGTSNGSGFNRHSCSIPSQGTFEV